MAKDRTADETPTAEIVSVKMPRELWTKLCVVAEHRGINKTEAMERFAGPGIHREYRKAVDEMGREFGGES